MATKRNGKLAARAGFWLLIAGLGATGLHAAPAPGDYFAIQVVDEATGRGVPLVELRTTNDIKYYTDSNGWVAFYEPGLMDQTVYFHLKSHGYEFPKDGFGYRGKALKTIPGRTEVLKLKRLNVAERLYRITGQGIYRDTILLGRKPPTLEPLFNGQVTGQDTVVVTPYRDKLFWFWGDTDRAAYPLGNFAVSGATSDLPQRGGPAAEAGINLKYFVDDAGFAKKMCPLPGEGLVWLEGVFTVPDPTGRERLLATYTRQKGLTPPDERGLAIFNDAKEVFEPILRFADKTGHHSSHPFRVTVAGREYWYLFPDWRVANDWRNVTNEASYEGFTCIAPGTALAGANTKLNRNAEGRLIYSWIPGAIRLLSNQQDELVKSGLMKPDERLWQMRDFDTGEPIPGVRGSVCWNQYRHCWIMIASAFGTVWLSQADTPTGPWMYARKIVTHDNYTFYNPAQHPFFDERDGRTIYFEGTYTDAFSGAKEKTPRYNYNQIMYRLSLDDERTWLPVPVYQVQVGEQQRNLFREEVEKMAAWGQVRSIPFFAFPPTQRGTNSAAGPTEGRGRVEPFGQVWTNRMAILPLDPSKPR